MPWDVVGVCDPASFLGVVRVGAGEISGRPALYLIADVVLGGDYHGHGEQNGSGDPVVESAREGGRESGVTREIEEELRGRDGGVTGEGDDELRERDDEVGVEGIWVKLEG